MAERVSLWTAPGLYGFYWLMFPAIWVLNKSSNTIINILKLKTKDGHDAQYSTEELKLILRSSHQNESFSSSEWKVLAQAIDFRELEVSDLMHPFHEAIVLLAEDSFEENIQRIVQHRYSRYPLVNNEGQVIGIVHIKDIFIALAKDSEFNDIESLIWPVKQVSPNTLATELFRQLQRGSPHFTVVAYKDNPPIGLLH